MERELKICEAARLVLSFCRYRRAADHLCYVRPASRHAAAGARRGQTSCIVVDLMYPIRWFVEVYRRGLAQASGCLVLDVVEEVEGGGLVVPACRQGRGCGLLLRHATARRGRDGWQLAWESLPGKYRPPPQDSPPAEADDYYRLAVMRLAARDIDAVLT